MNLIKDNPFLQGAIYAAESTGRTNDTILGVRKAVAAENLLSNLGAVKSQIQNRELERRQKSYERVQELMHRPESDGAMTIEQLQAQQIADQKAVAQEQMALEIANERDKQLGRDIINNASWMVAQMSPSEQGMASYFQPQIGGALSRFLGPQFSLGGRGAGGQSKMKFETVSEGGRTKYGAFDPNTGQFIEQGTMDDPMLGMDMMAKAEDITNKRLTGAGKMLDIEGKAMNNAASDMSALDEGNTRLVQHSVKLPPGFENMDEASQNEYLEAQMVARGMNPARTGVNFAGGRAELFERHSDVSPRSSRTGETKEKGLTPKQIADYRQDLAEVKAKMRTAESDQELRGLKEQYNTTARILNGTGKYNYGLYKVGRSHKVTPREFKRVRDGFLDRLKKKKSAQYEQYRKEWHEMGEEGRMLYQNDIFRYIMDQRGEKII
jgi:hypothetical protein